MTTPPNGLLGGTVAANLVGIATLVPHDGPTLPAAVVPRLAGGEPEEYGLHGLALQAVAGALAGAAFVPASIRLDLLSGVPPGRGEALLWTVAWSLLLFVGVLAVREGAIRDAERDEPGTVRLLSAHLAFGILFRLWVRLTWIT